MSTEQKVFTKEEIEYVLMVLAPLETIVKDLQGDFTLSLNYLNTKLAHYMELAAKSLGHSLFGEPKDVPEQKNQYARAYYLKYFNGLSLYFNNIK